MKILLISDTHGSLDRVYDVWERLSNIDMIIHCGDYEKDALALAGRLNVRVVSVKGNCDGAVKPDRTVVETPFGKLMVTHGHMEGADCGRNNLLYLADENSCIAACFGHTHAALCRDFDGIYLLNPGSLTKPRDGSGGTCIVIDSTEDSFHASIVNYDTLCGGSKKKEVQGGFLRGLLNYSDRF